MIKCIISKTCIVFMLIACIPFDVNGISYEYFFGGYYTSVHVPIVALMRIFIMPVKASGDDIERETVMTLSKSLWSSSCRQWRILETKWKSCRNSKNQ